MKKVIQNYLGKLGLSILLILGMFTAGNAQSVTMSTGNCSSTADEFQFDVFVTNDGPTAIQFNATVIRLTHSAAILAAGTNTIVFSYVSGSVFPNSFPPNSFPAFTYNSTTRLFGVSTGTTVYNNGGCLAPNIPSGGTSKLGRFSIKNTAQNFVPGSDVGLIWNTTTALIAYINCAATTTGFNSTNGNRTLSAPCSLFIPASCTSPTVAGSPADQTICSNGTATFTGSFTGGTPVPSMVWQVQTGGTGLFTDLTETAPYSNINTGTLTVTMPGNTLNTNRYRLKANNTCGDVFTNNALLTISPDVNAGTVTGISSLCTGATATYTSNGNAGGTWSSTNTSVATVNATSGLVKAVGAGSTDITYTIAAGCNSPASAFSSLTVTGIGALAGVPGGVKICSNIAVQSTGTYYSDASCNTIASVLPSGLVPVSGNIDVCVTVDNIVNTYQSLPYVQRHYDIEPFTNAANATATITLYFTQGEFDAYNLVRGPYPILPRNSVDLLGIANLRISQLHGTGTAPGNYSGPGQLINPDDNNIIWNNDLNRWEVSFNVIGFSGFYIHSDYSFPLPVNLLSFNGKNNGNNNLLEWSTSSEQNSSYFELMRSTDGINFISANRISAAGNSNTTRNYNYSDDVTAFTETVFYYRLKQVDISGAVKYSAIVKINLNNKGYQVDVLPNPFTSMLRLQIEATQNEKVTIILTDMKGRMLKQQVSSLRKGNNAIQIDDIGHLPGAVYLLKIITDTRKETIKVVKQ